MKLTSHAKTRVHQRLFGASEELALSMVEEARSKGRTRYRGDGTCEVKYLGYIFVLNGEKVVTVYKKEKEVRTRSYNEETIFIRGRRVKFKKEG